MIMIPPRIRNMMDIIDRLFVVVYASARIGQNMFNLQTSTDTSLAPIFICTTETDLFIVLNAFNWIWTNLFISNRRNTENKEVFSLGTGPPGRGPRSLQLMSEPGMVQFASRSLILKVFSDFKDFLEVIN